MYQDSHPAPAPETTRVTPPQLKMSNFSQEQLSSATNDEDDWEMISHPKTPRADAGQHQSQLPKPPAPDATPGLLTEDALAKQQAIMGSVPDRADKVGRWARSQSSHGDSLDAARPRKGMPPTDGVGHEAAKAERAQSHSKSRSSSLPSTSPSEGFAPGDLPNQVGTYVVGIGAIFDEPMPYQAMMSSLEELDLLHKKTPASKTSKGRK